jgi:hypothetical protein
VRHSDFGFRFSFGFRRSDFGCLRHSRPLHQLTSPTFNPTRRRPPPHALPFFLHSRAARIHCAMRQALLNSSGFIPISLLFSALFLLAGCATTPPVDWDARISHYTYDQAVLELGPPDKASTLSDGTVVAEWLTRRGGRGGMSFGVGTGVYRGGGGVSVGQTIGTGSPAEFLRLTFSPEGTLIAWNRLRN